MKIQKNIYRKIDLSLINKTENIRQDYGEIAGNPLIIQMTENESRKQLTPEEFENGLAKMVDAGMTQTEIAKLLSIRITRISDALAARKTRLKLDEQGIDTAGMSTSA